MYYLFFSFPNNNNICTKQSMPKVHPAATLQTDVAWMDTKEKKVCLCLAVNEPSECMSEQKINPTR